MTTISAQTILRSRNAEAPKVVLSTLLLRYPAFMHQDFMTHRAFSRNAMSTRAIPMLKMLRMILSDMAMPIHWGKNQGGMQAKEELFGFRRWVARTLWKTAGYLACLFAYLLYLVGVHKQVGNMILWPFMHFTTVVSSTEWDNFLELRDHPDARPEIQALAREMRKCLERTDDIQLLYKGEWHLPFVSMSDIEDACAGEADGGDYVEDLKKLSTARCASTSYKTVDGFDMTMDRAISLHDKLVAARPIHASPAEHVAQADERWVIWKDDKKVGFRWANPKEHGNFKGFRQYRHQLPA